MSDESGMSSVERSAKLALRRQMLESVPMEPFERYYAEGFFPNEYFNDPAEQARLAWVADKYGPQYRDLRNYLAAQFPGGIVEAGGYRIQPNQTPTGVFSWDPKDTSFFGLPGWMAPLSVIGGGLLAGGLSASGSGAAASAGLGEGIGTEAYFAGAGAPAAGEFSLATGASGAGLGSGTAGLELGSGAPYSLGSGATGYGLSGNAVVPSAFGVGGGVSGGLGLAAQTGTGALAKLLGVSDSTAQLLGAGGVTLAGLLGSNAQAGAYQDVASQSIGLGAPFRDLLQKSYVPDFNLISQPGYGDALSRIADISARSYASKFGNPAGSTTAQTGILNDVWQQGYLPALSNYRGQLGQFGGLGLNTAGQASLAGAGTAGGGYEALGYGLSQFMKPKNPWDEIAQKLALTIGGVRP